MTRGRTNRAWPQSHHRCIADIEFNWQIPGRCLNRLRIRSNPNSQYLNGIRGRGPNQQRVDENLIQCGYYIVLIFTYPLQNAAAVAGITKQYISCSRFILLSSFARRHKEQEKLFVGGRRFRYCLEYLRWLATTPHTLRSNGSRSASWLFSKKVMFVNCPGSQQPIIICFLFTFDLDTLPRFAHYAHSASPDHVLRCDALHVIVYIYWTILVYADMITWREEPCPPPLRPSLLLLHKFKITYNVSHGCYGGLRQCPHAYACYCKNTFIIFR